MARVRASRCPGARESLRLAVVYHKDGTEHSRPVLEALLADRQALHHTQGFFTEIPFPYAPLTTELAVSGSRIFTNMPKCEGKPPEGAGKEFMPTFQQAALMSLLLPGMMVGQENQFILSPVTQAKDYCLIETFNARKDFVIEHLTTQFKAEFFNLFNRTQLGGPNNNVQSSAFRSITSTTAPAREIQFGLKVLF